MGPEVTVVKSVLDILTRLHADAESQIGVLESQRFRVLAVTPGGAAETDCTSVQLALLRSALTELHTAIGLVEAQLPPEKVEGRESDRLCRDSDPSEECGAGLAQTKHGPKGTLPRGGARAAQSKRRGARRSERGG